MYVSLFVNTVQRFQIMFYSIRNSPLFSDRKKIWRQILNPGLSRIRAEMQFQQVCVSHLTLVSQILPVRPLIQSQELPPQQRKDRGHLILCLMSPHSPSANSLMEFPFLGWTLVMFWRRRRPYQDFDSEDHSVCERFYSAV